MARDRDERDAPVLDDEKTETPQEPVRPPPSDARHDREEQKRNRDRLRVDDEHKTPEMEKGHRGTFP